MNATRPARRRPIRPRTPRRGLSLVTVMAPLSAAVVLSVAILGSQTTAVQAVRNVSAGELARQAAETGLAAALDAIQDPAWGGVSSPLTAEVGRDAAAVWSYNVTFSQVAGDGTEIGAAAAALKLRVRSTGTWQALGGARPVSRAMEAVVSLTPRLPGRPARPNDVAAASDRSPDVAGFSQAQAYALCATGGGDSIVIAPQTRVTGNLWAADSAKPFQGLACSGSQQDDLLAGYGTDFGAGTVWPHPIAGSLSLYKDPAGSEKDDYSRMKTTWTRTGTLISTPGFDPNDYRTYRLYAGGFQYNAVEIGSTLQNKSLGPTDANPLGIFWCAGSLTVGDDVTVRGTLVAASGITVSGKDVAITAFDWLDGSGGTPVPDRSLWPLLPALVAGGNVTFTSAARALVEGPVLSRGNVNANTPDYAGDTITVSYSGTATARPLGGGLSEVRPSGLISGLLFTLAHSVQLGGTGGRWYPVVSTDLLGGTVVVRGTADFPSAVSCRSAARRLSSADVAGPVLASHITFSNPPAWQNLTSSTWGSKYSAWQSECATRSLLLSLVKPRTFSAYLADPLNWTLNGPPYTLSGLKQDPTVSVCRPSNVSYACEPPLFRPDPSARTAGGGYRWAVLSWREVTP